MSFASETRRELCTIQQQECCRHAEVYGILLFAHSFSHQSILLQTESEQAVRHAAELIAAETGIFPEIRIPLTRNRGNRICTLEIPTSQCEAVMECFGHSTSELHLQINEANIENDCCRAAFLRGMFLSCGTVSDPMKQYHFEFRIPKHHLFKDSERLMSDLKLAHFNSAERKNTHIIYCKASEEIADILTFLGAPQASMQLMQIKMLKEVRNTANRLRNLDTANIDKTLEASSLQLQAIKKLKESGKFDVLPEQLRELANLREENPEMSLRELGEHLSQPLSRSGVNHRLEKIVSLANEDVKKKK